LRAKPLSTLLLLILYCVLVAVAVASGERVDTGVYYYDLTGEYTGILEITASGRYKAALTGNTSDTAPGYLKVNYKFSFFLVIAFSQNSFTVLYGYNLSDYSIVYRNFPEEYVAELDSMLSRKLGELVVEYSTTVNPRILLEISPALTSIEFTDFTEYYGNVSAIVLFEDNVCFAHYVYSEEDYRTHTYKYISSVYYNALTYTPLYFYRFRSLEEKLDENSYIRVREVVGNSDIGFKLSKLTRSNTVILKLSGNVHGRIGLISLGGGSELSINATGSKAVVEVSSKTPYRLVIVIDGRAAVKQASIKLISYQWRTLNVYVSPLTTRGSVYEIEFTQNITEITPQHLNASHVHEVTVEEKPVNAVIPVIATVLVNAILIYAVYRASKALARIIVRKLESS